MDIQIHQPLSNYTTIRIGGPAHFVADIRTVEELMAVETNAKRLGQKTYVIGGGSNLIGRDEGFDGVIIRNQIPGFDVIADDSESTTLKIGSGELWDSVVARTVDMQLSGIEALSLIPGTAGAAPVQNVGAYGQEVADTLQSVEAYDTTSGNMVELSWQDCEFSYRHSIFRGSSYGRYVITSITLKLYKKTPEPPFYAALQSYLDEHGIHEYDVATVREAVIAIRKDKLPDPSILPNAGSFFKNAIVEDWQRNSLLEQHPDMPSYKMDEKHYKIPTGWLIEQTGLKGESLHNMKVHDANALVLINQSATSYQDLANARAQIVGAVRDLFQITIEQEPLEITNQ